MRIHNVKVYYDEHSSLGDMSNPLCFISKVVLTTDFGEEINVNKMIDEYNAMKKQIEVLKEECCVLQDKVGNTSGFCQDMRNNLTNPFTKPPLPKSVIRDWGYKLMSEAENLNESCAKSYEGSAHSINIVDYFYNKDKKATTLKFADGTITTCKESEPLDSRYMGFMICVAKKAMENQQNVLTQADYWIDKKLKQELKVKEEIEKRKKEEKELIERQKEKARKRKVKKRAKEIQKEYLKTHSSIEESAEEVAMKKYGVPVDYFMG